MSSEIDTSINVCLLDNVKEGDLLGLGMWGVGFIPREAPSREVYNLVAREAPVYHTGIARPA